MPIEVGEPESDDRNLKIPIKTSGDSSEYILDDFKAAYSESINDVPPSLLVIPALANILPIAWASDSEIHVACIDAKFQRAVDDVREEFNNMYPDLASGRVLTAENTVENPSRGSDSMILFSGGVDSLATFIRHREESPHLVSVRGADIRLDNEEAWSRVTKAAKSFSDANEVELLTVSTNFQEMLDYFQLDIHYGLSITGSWWPGVQHGLALLGVTAPLTWKRGVSNLYIAASHTEEFSVPWGSCPDIDNNVSWSGVDAHHDGFEISRQQKIEIISSYVRDTGDSLLIRSCTSSDSGDNCGKCEKCARTIVGLEIEGLDPVAHGYPVEDNAFEYFKRSLKNGHWTIGEDERFMWSDLQQALPSNYDQTTDEAEEFLQWLQNQDIDSFYEASQPSLPIQAFKKTFPHLPKPIYRGILLTHKKISTYLD